MKIPLKYKKIIILLLLFLNISNLKTNILAETILSEFTEKLKLDLYILESKFDENNYVSGNIHQYGFTPYNEKRLPSEITAEKKMYTFRTDFYIDQLLKDEKISIYIGPQDYPYNIYINGNKIFSSGNYKNIYRSSTYDSKNIILPPNFLKFNKNKNELAIQIYPKYETTPIGDIILTTYNNITVTVFFRNLLNLYLIQGASLIAFILFLYFLFIFAAYKFNKLKYLYFSFMCIFFILSYFNIAYSHDMVNEIINEKLSRIGFPICTMFLAFFLIEFSKIFKQKKKIKYIIHILIFIPTIIITIITLLQPTKQTIHKIFETTMFFIILPILLFSIVILIISVIRSLIKKKSYVVLVILIGFLMIILTSIHDIYYTSNNLTPYAWLVPYGYLVMVLCIFFSLSFEQAKLYMRSENNWNEIKIKNNSLKIMMDNIFTVSQSLIQSSSHLEENVNTTMSILEKYHNSNKKILDKILYQFNDVEIMINQVENRLKISSEKIPKAIEHQSVSVKDVNKTITKINSHIEATSISSIETNNKANELAAIADESSKKVIESKKSIVNISQHTNFINEILNSIEDITEKTNILAINASIEAANSGDSGKGFSVIANEIRNLAFQSKNRLASSFENLSNMEKVINKSSSLSEEVSKQLFNIIDEAKKSALKINHITDLINEQKNQSNIIVNSIESLLQDTLDIKKICEEEINDDEKIKNTLFNLKDSFNLITDLLKEQETSESELYSSLENIKKVMNENLKNVDILNESIQK